MKPDLQRIEETLSRLQIRHPEAAQPGSDHASTESDSLEVLPTSKLLTVPTASCDIPPGVGPEPLPPALHPDHPTKSPALPPFTPPEPHNPRQATHPGLALGILKEIETSISSWHRELKQLQIQIEEVYMEGPIVDGWLESHPADPSSPPPSLLRHAEIDRLLNYVEMISNQSPNALGELPRADYRLCGLDADGQLWTRPCPADQVAQVSLAIARFQKLRQLLKRKQYLESRLSQLSESLVTVHSQLQDPTSAHRWS